jgi:hypothetical protein
LLEGDFCRILQRLAMNKSDHILMQYETPLADDLDMDLVQLRVRKMAPRFDQYPGMIWKLFGVNEIKDSAVNEYTSIYLWKSPEPMRGHLEGDLFENYSQTFARPNVRTWLIHDIFGDTSSLARARFSMRRISSIPRQVKVGTFLESWTARERETEALLQVIGFDPWQWQLADFTIWPGQPEPRDFGHVYSLVHVSLPEAGKEGN